MTSVKLCFLAAILSTAASVPVDVERRDAASVLPPLTITQDTYKAAVLNHMPAEGYRNTRAHIATREEALRFMSANLDVFERQAAIAGQQDVDILVFPDGGLFGGVYNVDSVQAFLENVPDPKKETWNPCIQPTKYNDTEVQHRLSCMARNNSLYIVANMASKQPCPNCSYATHATLNTNVVYDPSGVLIARYLEKNLFDVRYSILTPYDPTTFDTSFGRFALLREYDSFLRDPAIDLIERYNVDSVAYPAQFAAFMKPLLSGNQWFSAFASGIKVNLLTAGNVYIKGSGIYTPSGPAVYARPDERAQLLIATIPSRPTTFQIPTETPIPSNLTSDQGEFQIKMFYDDYNVVKLEGANGTATACTGLFCCQAVFSRRIHGDDFFVLGAFSGRHTAFVQTDIQVCALLKCPGRCTCGRGDLNNFSQTHFTSLVLKGNFNTKYVFPEILLSRGYSEVLPGQEWSFSKNAILSDNGFSEPLLSAIMIGRSYSSDMLYPPGVYGLPQE